MLITYADRGFAPMRYDVVDESFGTFDDIELMERTKNGRDINRHYYTAEDVEKEQSRPVVQKLKELMELRNTHPAFSLDGTIEVSADGDRLVITRKYGLDSITLNADLSTYQFDIK